MESQYVPIRDVAVRSGGYGSVHVCRDVLSGTYVAIKHVPSRTIQREHKRELRELHIMQHLCHPNVVPLVDAFVDPVDPAPNTPFSLCLVMPYIQADLRTYIQQRAQMPLACAGDPTAFHRDAAAAIIFQVLYGVDFMHKCGIVHRDLKPENVLVTVDVSNPMMNFARIADFGLSRDVSFDHASAYVCARPYRPPEVITAIEGTSGSPKVDVWSIGCILYEILTGEMLFSLPTALDENGQWCGMKASHQLMAVVGVIGTMSDPADLECIPCKNVRSFMAGLAARPRQLEQMIARKCILDMPPKELLMWTELISACLQFHPHKRPTVEELCRHKLFVSKGIEYGVDDLQQKPVNKYKPLGNLSRPDENIRRILEIVKDIRNGSLQPDVNNVAFPTLADENLTRTFLHWDVRTHASVQTAISQILEMMDRCDDGTRMNDLSLLLNHFVVMQPSETVLADSFW